MRLVLVLGTNNEYSIVNRIADDIGQNIKMSNLSFEKIYLSKSNIEYCSGCRTCFKKGFCRYDLYDDLQTINEKLKNADVIIFISSVYFHNVPGKLKTLIDRLSYKAHLLEYSDKLGFTIVTTFSTGADIVKDYLSKFQINLGMQNVNNFIFVEKDLNYMDFILETSECIKVGILDGFYFDQYLNTIFNVYKSEYNNETLSLYKELNYFPENEIKYWNQNWIKRTQSFKEFRNRKIKSDYLFNEDKAFLKSLESLEVEHE